MIHLIILVFAFVFAVCAAFNISWPKLNFGWLAIALFVLSFLLGGIVK